MSVLTPVRHGLLAAARGAGVFRMVGDSRWRTDRLCILCFHGIALEDEHLWRPELYLTPQQFRERMRSLESVNATVLPLGEALTRLREGTLPPRAVVITFDDGLHDFHAHALPELDARGFPATVYLTTYYSGRDEPVLPLVLDYMLWKSRDERYGGWPSLGVAPVEALSQPGARPALAARLASAIRRASRDQPEQHERLAEFASTLGTDAEAIRRARLVTIMSPDEVLDASRRDISIELHTHRHRTPRDRDLFLRELTDNREAIEQMVGRRPTHFCYPSGDVDSRMFPWLREAGVTSATTCRVALADRTSDCYLLPRFLDSSGQPDVSFEGWVTGAAAFVSRHGATTVAPDGA
jgi:peptidoglycan/xylan/chitin deacetylase (PgdA/CDA1 family)